MCQFFKKEPGICALLLFTIISIFDVSQASAQEQFDWQPPLDPSVCWETGSYYQPYLAYNQYEAHHTGIDIRCPTGTTVVAPASGTVYLVQEGWWDYQGWDVWIAHDAFDASGNQIYSLLAHLSQATVAPGQKVDRGQSIGVKGEVDTHFGMSNKPPEAFGYFYEHAEEQSDGRGWIDPKSVIIKWESVTVTQASDQPAVDGQSIPIGTYWQPQSVEPMPDPRYFEGSTGVNDSNLNPFPYNIPREQRPLALILAILAVFAVIMLFTGQLDDD